MRQSEGHVLGVGRERLAGGEVEFIILQGARSQGGGRAAGLEGPECDEDKPGQGAGREGGVSGDCSHGLFEGREIGYFRTRFGL